MDRFIKKNQIIRNKNKDNVYNKIFKKQKLRKGVIYAPIHLADDDYVERIIIDPTIS